MTSIEPLEFEWAVVDGVATVVVTGELDMFSVPRLRTAFRSSQTSPVDSIVVDLAGLSFIDVRGLELLVEAAGGSQDLGINFSVRSPSPAFVRMRQLVGVDEADLLVEH